MAISRAVRLRECLLESFDCNRKQNKKYFCQVLFVCLQRKGQEGYDPDFDEESTMVEDSVTPSK